MAKPYRRGAIGLAIAVTSLGGYGGLQANAQTLSVSCSPTDIQAYIQILEDPKRDAALAIEALSLCGEIAADELVATLKQSTDWDIRQRSLITLIRLDDAAVDYLLATVESGPTPPEIRLLAIDALVAIAQTPGDVKLEIRAFMAERAADPLEDASVRVHADLALEQIQIPPQRPWYDYLLAPLERYPQLTTIGMGLMGLTGVYLTVLGLRPQWLLWMPGQLAIPGTQITLPVALLRWLKYQPRVLDWWVREHFEAAKNAFLKLHTVDDRAIHVPIQIQLDTELVDTLTPSQLMPEFNHSPACLLIIGEGGIGKTSLACQIARWGLGLVDNAVPPDEVLCDHPMIPILIEQELGETPLLKLIQDQMPRLRDGSFVAEDLLKALLQRRRVLVILDHVSEMSEPSYDAMQHALEATPINALIITARLRAKNLGRAHYALLQPQKLEGVKLPFFIQTYVEQKLKRTGQRSIFQEDYTELYRASTRLSGMMSATLQSATALLVRMYADQVIEVGGLKTAQLPDNIPDLMAEYVAWLNRQEAVDPSLRRKNWEVQRDAGIVAWECLKKQYRATDARVEQVLTALAATDGDAQTTPAAAMPRLDYLHRVLRLVQDAAGGTAVRMPLDTVAEYLAALHVTAYCQAEDSEARWQAFLESVDAQPDRQSLMRGFLLAMRNCCDRVPRLPEGVMAALTERAQLDSEELRQAQLRYRINRLIDDLYDIHPKYLGQAIRNLRDEGDAAYRAVPDLLRVLRSNKVPVRLRINAVDALVAICPDGERLQVPFEVLFHDVAEVDSLRIRLGQALRRLGFLKDVLVVEQPQADAPRELYWVPIPATHTVELPDRVALGLVRIPAGEVCMGSAVDDPTGKESERPPRLITVPGFWMGRYPITREQWRAIAQLPPVRRSLPLNPSDLRAEDTATHDHCPVDSIAWEAAVECCDRLTQWCSPAWQFRLPTEAEWEYACRAGTQTPFHLGYTLTKALANYRSQATTPVGSFEVANRFGLYDLHGNVYEWCQDVWHDTYHQAPTDAGPWLQQGDRNRRVIRGGAWLNGEQLCRSAARDASPTRGSDLIGMRVVAVPLTPEASAESGSAAGAIAPHPGKG